MALHFHPVLRSRSITTLAVSGLIVLAAGCGGGGGGTSPDASAPTETSPVVNTSPVTTPEVKTQPADPVPVASTASFDVNAAITNFALSATPYTLTALDPKGNEYSVATKKYGPFKITHFSISPDEINDIVESHTFTINGQPQIIDWGGSRKETYDWQTLYYKTSPFTILGYSENMGSVELPVESHTPPATAKIGDAGTLTVMPKVFVTGSTAEQDVKEWALEADTADTAWFCLRDRVLTTVGTTSTLSGVQSKECARVTPAGAVLGFKADLYFDDPAIGVLRFR